MASIKNQVANQTTNNNEIKAQQKTVSQLVNSMLDSEGLRKRFDELLGQRTPQFVSSIVSLISNDVAMKKVFAEAPLTIIQSAMKAATFDLPIEPSLGYAYIVPFKRKVKTDNGFVYRNEATFIPGYKGLIQLCLRTGAYSRVPDAIDVREGELLKYDRLTGDCEFKWEEDEEVRESLPIIGYAGYFRLKNGAEKTIYMSVKQIQKHEEKNRKGEKMSKTWIEDFDSMARKTVIRRLASKYALMSINYQNANEETIKVANEMISPEDNPEVNYEDIVIEATEVQEVNNNDESV